MRQPKIILEDVIELPKYLFFDVYLVIERF